MNETNDLAIKVTKEDMDVVVAKDEDKEEEDNTILRIKKKSQNGRATRGRGRGSYTNGRPRYDKSQIKCYNCQNFGHYASECRNATNHVEEKTNIVEKEDEVDHTERHKGNESGAINSW